MGEQVFDELSFVERLPHQVFDHLGQESEVCCESLSTWLDDALEVQVRLQDLREHVHLRVVVVVDVLQVLLVS